MPPLHTHHALSSAPRTAVAALGPVTLVVTLAMTLACGDRPARDTAATARAAAPAPRVIPGPAATPPRSPDRWQARFTTSKGDFVVAVERSLAPRAADRFYELVTIGYFDGTRFFRIVPGFITQWGIHGDTAVSAQWNDAEFPDEPMRTPNVRGTIAFAANGPDSRAAQVFVSTGDNRKALDRQRVFAPFGRVVEGMDVVDALNAEYGEEPSFIKIVRQGNAYLRRWFPALDSVVTARVDSTTR
ncbi:MAG: peptidylprolyl isomerase [Gemmatimonadetes bacterium]|nr:peptidylprolyl isomerase [Gemmatimonadota bacterium]